MILIIWRELMPRNLYLNNGMKSLVLGFCLVILSVSVRSQAVTDSIYSHGQSYQRLQFSKTAASQLLALPVERAAMVQLQLQGLSGNYRSAQTAQRSSIATFRSEGIATLNRFKMSGYFSYSHADEDSLAWNQQGLNTDERPFYFASAKAGPYLREKYHMGGQLAYRIQDTPWSLGAGIDYLYNSSTRSVDPRPLVRTFKLMIKPEVIYHWKHHLASIGFTLGKGYEDNSLSYTNSSYQQNASEIYKDWITYFVTGYGAAYPQRENLSFSRNQRYKGIGLSYSGMLGRWELKAVSSYLLNEEMNRTETNNSLNYMEIANYQLESIEAQLLADKESGNVRHQIGASLSFDNGSGYYNRIGAKNYYFERKSYSVNYSFMHKATKKMRPEFRLGAEYESLQRKDLSVYLQSLYSRIKPYIGMTVYNSTGIGDRLIMSLDATGFIPVENELLAPESTVTEFTRGVIYPDYYFFKSFGGALKGRVGYVTHRLFKSCGAGISAQAQLNRKLSSPEATLPAYFIAGNNQLSYSLSLNLFF